MQCVWVLLVFLSEALSEKFTVKVPRAPVLSASGSDVDLPCSVRNEDNENLVMNAEELSVKWSRSDLNDSLVHLYVNRTDLNTHQIPSYRGRTSVLKEDLKGGTVSLKISNVRVSDEGKYTCRVDSSSWKSSATITLSVKAAGSEPVISVEKYESGKFSLLCESKGWFPEPDLQWRNSKGDNLTAAQTERQPVGDLFNIKSRITVEKIDSFFCTVTQRYHVKKGRIDAHTLCESVPNHGRTAAIIIGVIVLLVFFVVVVVIYGIRWGEIRKVTSLMNSGRDECLLHHALSDRQWEHVEKLLLNPEEKSLLKSEENLEEFNLRRFYLSDEGVQKLKNVIAASTKAQLEYCNLTERSCVFLASVLQSQNSLIELNLSVNDLQDSGVKKLSDGLNKTTCKLQILRLEYCNLTESSCADLASVLQSQNSLIELNLSKNYLQDSGVKELSDGLKKTTCKLQILRLAGCCITDTGCDYLTSALQQNPSFLKELDLSRNPISESGQKFSRLKKACPGLNVIA